MLTRPNDARQAFIDDELMRVPMLADQVLDATWLALQDTMGGMRAHERSLVADLLQAGRNHRARLVDRFTASVREQLQPQPAQAAAEAAGPASRPRQGLALALIDETAVAADVEISRALEAVRAVAEHELRELATYTAALAGDMDLSQDHNPFRPELFARALWDAAQALPMSRGHQLLLMRQACTPLAQVLRKAYAGACARLEGSGVEPAAYRTLIIHPGQRGARPDESWRGAPPDLRRIREAMPTAGARPAATTVPPATPAAADLPPLALPLDRLLSDAARALRAMPADAPVTAHAELLASQRTRLVRHARSTVEQQLIELLSRLFETMLQDQRVPRDVRALLARLQPAALRIVLQEPATLEDYAHPIWQLMDEIVHQAAVAPPDSPTRVQVLKQAERLAEQLADDPAPDADSFRRAIARFAADSRVRFNARLARAAEDTATLQSLEDELLASEVPLPTGFGPLDETQLETVPAELFDMLPEPREDAPDAAAWLDAQRPGDWVRLFCQGNWRQAQLLWQGRHGDVWLFAHGPTTATVALRRRALARLYGEGMLYTLRRRSVLRSAAVRLVRDGAEFADAA